MNAIVTGATRGIGLSIVRHLASNNYNLALCARNELDLISLKQDLSEKFPHLIVIYYAADLADREQVKSFATFVSKQFKFTDVLVNNAGLFIPSSLFEEKEDDLDHQMQVNLFTPHYLSKYFGLKMKEAGKGHIINICSIASLEPVVNAASYSVSKIALLGFTRILRKELALYGVKVTAILPGSTLTSSWDGTTIVPDFFVDPEDIALIVMNCLNMSSGANVEEVIIRPLKEME